MLGLWTGRLLRDCRGDGLLWPPSTRHPGPVETRGGRRPAPATRSFPGVICDLLSGIYLSLTEACPGYQSVDIPRTPPTLGDLAALFAPDEKCPGREGYVLDRQRSAYLFQRREGLFNSRGDWDGLGVGDVCHLPSRAEFVCPENCTRVVPPPEVAAALASSGAGAEEHALLCAAKDMASNASLLPGAFNAATERPCEMLSSRWVSVSVSVSV